MKYPKIHGSTEILKLFTTDATYQERCGYYAYDHWDSQSFAIAINQEYDLASNEAPVWAKEVKQGYVKTVATDVDLPDAFIFSQLPRSGYVAITYVDT